MALPTASTPDHGGLSAREAALRLAQDGPNLLPSAAPKRTWAIVLEVLREPMFLMLLAAGGIYLLLGDRGEAVFLLGFVFIVIGITLVQQRKTQRALESLHDLSAPRALVIRDGHEQRIAVRDVVVGDLLVLHEGDRIAADAQLIHGHLTVDESLLTGESVTVDKLADATLRQPADPGAATGAALFASTVVTKGVGLAVVQAVGATTAVGRIGTALAQTTEPPSGLQQASRALTRNLTTLALMLASALALVSWLWDGRTPLQSLLAGIALAMAILPEEIPVILTVFLALGAWRLSRKNVLTRRVPAVEALGAITVLAADKTGTLTQNRMQVTELAVGDAIFDGSSIELPELFHGLVEFAMLATPLDPFDPMEKAIQAFGHEWLAGTEHVHDDRSPAFQYDLAPDILAMTRVFAGSRPDTYLLATKGAPEAVADLCHLPTAARQEIHRRVEAMGARGLRVLGVARGAWRAERHEAPWPASQHDFDFTFMGLVGLVDPPRAEVSDAIAECRAAGVRVVMMTGDHPETARAIASQIGLSGRAEVITGPEIATLDDVLLRERLRHADVCARLAPEHKLRLVRALQADGQVVAMTGDGVNDAPALKAADVGIAMGERGTDVAREAAALVLLDDSFASIVQAIRGGRRIYDNITKATRFVFAVHVPVIVLAILPAILHWPMLLLPVHILLLQLVIDPACSIVFEAEPASADVMRRPPNPLTASPFTLRNIGYALMQGMGVAVLLSGGYELLQRSFGWADSTLRLTVVTSLVLSVLVLIFANRGPSRGASQRNPWLFRLTFAVLLLLASLLAALLGIAPLRAVMGFAPPTAAALSMAVLLATACAVWLELLHLLARRLRSS